MPEDASNAPNVETSQSTPSPSQHQSSSFEDPPTVLAPDDQTQYDVAPHVSDCLLYDRGIYTYPSPILAMMGRSALDAVGRGAESFPLRACGRPRKLFSLTGGYIPVTGLQECDEQSFDYYTMLPLPREPECVIPYCFSIDTIQALQHELCTGWQSVYPRPIPPVIFRSHDFIGYNQLNSGVDGYAFVEPIDNSIWPVICQRGIHPNFRPLHPFAMVETYPCIKGDALYDPQHVVASKFAVNVFLEFTNATGPTPFCEYLGAYVLQVVSEHKFDIPSLGRLHLMFVKFCYYKWDQCMLGLADEPRRRNIVAASQDIIHQAVYESESVGPCDDSDHSDSVTDPYGDCNVDKTLHILPAPCE